MPQCNGDPDDWDTEIFMRHADEYRHLIIHFSDLDNLFGERFSLRNPCQPKLYIMMNRLDKLTAMPNLKMVEISAWKNDDLEKLAKHYFSEIQTVLLKFPTRQDGRRRCMVNIIVYDEYSDRGERARIKEAWRKLGVRIKRRGSVWR